MSFIAPALSRLSFLSGEILISQVHRKSMGLKGKE